VQSYEDEVLVILNKARVEKGLHPLVMNESLRASARVRAVEIIELFDHKRPDGSSATTVVAIPWSYFGENIAAGHPNPISVYNAWNKSAGHHRNMFYENFRKIGIGCYRINNLHYWVQLFTD
jgi:uncharacterized protein YkwD